MNTTYIYGLYSSNNKEIRYIGKSNNPKDRLRKHIYECFKNNNENKTHKCCWIRNSINKGKKVDFIILDECDFELWPEYECKYMALYDNLTNTSKGGIGGSPITYNMTYNELLKWKNENLPSYIDTHNKWKSYIKVNNVKGIPLNPNKVYSNRGWSSWSSFLNTNNKSPNHYIENNLSFDEFKKWIKSSGINSRKDFINLTKSPDFPNNMPKKPNLFYKDKGWTKWYDLVDGCIYTKGVYWDFNKCQKYLKDNYGSITVEEFRNLTKNRILPSEIPKKPERVFDNFSYSVFLNNKNKRDKNFYISFLECKNIAKKNNIKSRNEWTKFVKNSENNNLPGSPDWTYSEVWVSWFDFLDKKVQS